MLVLRRFLGLASLAAVALCHPATAFAQATERADSAVSSLDAFVSSYVVGPIYRAFFVDVAFWDGVGEGVVFPFILAWLIGGAVFFTLRYRFVNVWAFRHALIVVTGRFDDPNAPGEVSHFQALSSALSATVGLGNIAGVAIAVNVGGPGAVLWMILAGFLGMSAKFTECTLGVAYRDIDASGRVLGGPMRYLDKGLGELGFARLGKGLSVFFAVLCLGGSVGGGNMFQANQSCTQLLSMFPSIDNVFGRIGFGVGMAVLVGLVIIGGMKRIGAVAGVIVPVMCGFYVLAGIFILIVNAAHIPAAFGTMFEHAFHADAVAGGGLGALLAGFQRAAFSNEAGIGSAAIAHSAAATKEPIREGFVALLEPFIDTVIVCTMTGLVVVVTDAWQLEGKSGVELTSYAFGSVVSWFPVALTVAVLLFAYSTMISWSYYGERCFSYLFKTSWAPQVYRSAFLVFTVLGAILPLSTVVNFSDLMILGMALPNIFGVVMLSGRVADMLRDYRARFLSKDAFTGASEAK